MNQDTEFNLSYDRILHLFFRVKAAMGELKRSVIVIAINYKENNLDYRLSIETNGAYDPAIFTSYEELKTFVEVRYN